MTTTELATAARAIASLESERERYDYSREIARATGIVGEMGCKPREAELIAAGVKAERARWREKERSR